MNLEHRKENDEKKGGSENVHPYGMKITGASTADVLSRKKSWFYDEVFQRAEELTIEMREVVKEMSK